MVSVPIVNTPFTHTAVKCVTDRGRLLQTTASVTTVMAVLTKHRSGTVPSEWKYMCDLIRYYLYNNSH